MPGKGALSAQRGLQGQYMPFLNHVLFSIWNSSPWPCVWKAFILSGMLKLTFVRDQGIPGGASGKEPTCGCRRCKRCRDQSLGRSPGGEHGNPPQCSCLEYSPMDRGAWRATVHRVAQGQTQLKWLNMQAIGDPLLIHSINTTPPPSPTLPEGRN